MSILGNIVSSIFHHASSPASAAPSGAPSPQSKPATHASSAPAGGTVDVAAIMDKLASQSKEKLDWRRSIVDMMKLLNLDSSMSARKHLAEELHYKLRDRDWDILQPLARRHRLPRDMAMDPFHGIGCSERQCAREHLIERDSE